MTINNTSLSIMGTSIRQDSAGRYCLNDCHKAAGGDKAKQPSNFLRLDTTQDLIEEISRSSDVRNAPTDIKQGGKDQGTYVCRELVYAYGEWISAGFHLTVIRAFDDLVRGNIPTPINPTFDPTNFINLALSEFPNLSPISRQCMIANVSEVAFGRPVLPLPQITERTYSATEVGQMLDGISANQIGRAANKHGLKTEEYGITVVDKSRHSSKQVESFRYNQKAVDRLRDIFS